MPRLDRAGLPSVRAAPQIELERTPFFAQELHQCGPAALATVLAVEHVDVSPEQLADEIYIPGREGSLQTEMLAAVRAHGRVGLRLAPQLEAVLAPLREGRPVLLLQNLGLASLPAWHYAVLIGWDAPADELILRSGREARERMSLARFLQTWELAGRWAVVIANPAEPPPASATAADWVAAVAPLESLHQTTLARTAYESAALRWPGEALVWQALANARYGEGDSAGAERALESAVVIEPNAAALNNLAQLRVERGCRASALATLDQIRAPPPALAGAIDDTRREAAQLPSAEPIDCR